MRKHLSPTTLAERCRSYVPFYQELEDWVRRTETTCGENPIPPNGVSGQSLRGALALLDEVRPRIEKLVKQIETPAEPANGEDNAKA